MSIVILLAVALVLATMLIWPKLGTWLIWPILFAYPHNWWYYNNPLPLNIGGDDLFCIGLFLIVLVRRCLLGGVPYRLGYAFWVITAFCMIAAVANFSGAYQTEDVGYQKEAIKGVLKPVVFWALFFAIIHCIDSPKDLRTQYMAFTVAVAVGAALVIVQNYLPQLLDIFAEPGGMDEGYTYESRGAGAFLNPNAAAYALGSGIIMAIASTRLRRGIASRLLCLGVIALLLIAVLFTRSRSGVLALLVAGVGIGLVGRQKAVAWVAIVMGVVAVWFFSEVRELFQERIAIAYDPGTGRWGPNVLGRFDTWKSYFETATASDYLLGQGPSKALEKNGSESHNAYVSLVTVYGIWGGIWAVLALRGFIRKVVSSRKSTDEVCRVVAEGCVWVLVLWGVYAWTSDAISSYYPRYILFYIVVLIDRASWLAKEEAVWREQSMSPDSVGVTSAGR